MFPEAEMSLTRASASQVFQRSSMSELCTVNCDLDSRACSLYSSLVELSQYRFCQTRGQSWLIEYFYRYTSVSLEGITVDTTEYLH